VPLRRPDEPERWLDRPGSVRLLKRLAWACVLVLFGLDFVLHYHEHTGWENVPGFYTLSGFLASVLLIVAAKVGGKPLKRGEDHYG
jgi:hypothetical protein